jgi:uncharacterized protein
MTESQDYVAIAGSAFVQNLSNSVASFVDPLIRQLISLGLRDHVSVIDHVCYRVGDLASYERLKDEVESVASLLSEAFINGRPIATYQLHSPITLSSGFSVSVLELPAPKLGVDYDEGWEHIEAVTHDSLDVFMARFRELKFNIRNLDAPINKDISLRLDGGLIKFHEAPLAAVIAEEQRVLTLRGGRGLAVFDFDDTLLGSKEPFLKAFHLAYRRVVDGSISFADLCAKQRPTYPEFFSNLGVSEQATIRRVLEAFIDEWEGLAGDCILPVGIKSLLSCLVSEGVEIHVWTARDPVTTASTLRTFGLSRFISGIHGFDPLHPGKPHPTTELTAAARGRKSIVIGDSQSDQNGAAYLGSSFLQAAWVHRNGLDVAENCICTMPLASLERILANLSRPD